VVVTVAKEIPEKYIKTNVTTDDWIHLAQDRDRWWAVVITVINLWVP
jgi:hypothetical protein